MKNKITLLYLFTVVFIACDPCTTVDIIIVNNTIDTIYLNFDHNQNYEPDGKIYTTVCYPKSETIYSTGVLIEGYYCHLSTNLEPLEIKTSSDRILKKDISLANNWYCEQKNIEYVSFKFIINEDDLE